MPLEMRYFILKPKGNSIHAQASRCAMKAYAYYLLQANDPDEMAKDIFDWINSEEAQAGLERETALKNAQFQNDLDTEDD